MPRPHRNCFYRQACILIAGLLLAACGPDCTSVCEKHRACMGDEAGSLTGCIDSCNASDFPGKDESMQCIADSSCSEVANGACAPTCAQVCARAIACDVPTDALCSTTCAGLTYAQQECYIVNDCSVVLRSCTGLTATSISQTQD